MNQLTINRHGFGGMSDLPGIIGELPDSQGTYGEVFCKELGPSSSVWRTPEELSGGEND